MKPAYREGDWIAVPLRNGGYALGRVARGSRRGGILLGYFFAPVRQAIPSLSDLEDLTPNEAVLVCLFGDLDLINGVWPIIGQAPGQWNRNDWPLPSFGYLQPLTGRYLRRVYNEDRLDDL